MIEKQSSIERLLIILIFQDYKIKLLELENKHGFFGRGDWKRRDRSHKGRTITHMIICLSVYHCQENEKDKEENGEDKDNCNNCKSDQEVVFIQVCIISSIWRFTIFILGSRIHREGCCPRSGTIRHSGVQHGAGPGDSPTAHGPGGHVPSHMLLPSARRDHSW